MEILFPFLFFPSSSQIYPFNNCITDIPTICLAPHWKWVPNRNLFTFPSLPLPSIVFNCPSHSLQHSTSSLMPSSLKEQLIFIEQLECTKYCAKVITCIISLDPQTLLNRYYDHFLNVRKSKLSQDSNSKGK